MVKTILRTVGSLWFAALLLLLLLVAMAYATVFESLRGTERALDVYYRGWWFQGLLGILALNALAALLYRFPFSKKQIGFVLTHAGLLVTLAGTLTTRELGVEGQIGLAEGQSGDEFYLSGGEALVVSGGRESQPVALDIARVVPDRFAPVTLNDAPSVKAGDLQAQPLRYLPDCDWQRRVSDDSPTTQPAIEVSLSPGGEGEPVWVLPGQATPLGTKQVSYRLVSDRDELLRLSSPATAPEASKGRVRIEREGKTFEFTVEEGLKGPVPLGDSGYTAQVLRYLPHATVGSDKQITSASDRPVNPYVEVEVSGPAGKETRRAFAKFPEFGDGHATTASSSLTVRLLAAAEAPPTPIEVLGGPDTELHVRFLDSAGAIVVRALTLGQPVDTPWAGQRFTVLRQFEHARVQWALVPIEPVRAQRVPGVLVRLSTPAQTNEIWLQKNLSRSLTVDGLPYEVSYVDRTYPLGFTLQLEQFRIGRYPGSERPRSFESRVTVTDPRTGRTQSAVISMNHPLSFGGFTLYQSSYRQESGHWISFLSVARDPGQLVVFTGYIAVIVGMILVLVTRMTERQSVSAATAPGSIEAAGSPG